MKHHYSWYFQEYFYWEYTHLARELNHCKVQFGTRLNTKSFVKWYLVHTRFLYQETHPQGITLEIPTLTEIGLQILAFVISLIWEGCTPWSLWSDTYLHYDVFVEKRSIRYMTCGGDDHFLRSRTATGMTYIAELTRSTTMCRYRRTLSPYTESDKLHLYQIF